MKKGLTELVFILDRSGSMGGLESDTIGGYNSLIEKQKQEPGLATVTTVLFDDQYELLHDRAPLTGIAGMTDKQYFVRGSTALLDAIGRTVTKIENAHKNVIGSELPENTLIVITTDGMENASREYTYDRVKQLVERQKEKGWEFLFLGANMDAIGTARRFGIDADRAATYSSDSAGTRVNYEAINDAVKCVRSCAPMNASWKASIDRDQERRKREHNNGAK